jgi:hypothetical protein
MDPITALGAVSAFLSLVDLCFKLCQSLNTLREGYLEASAAINGVKGEVSSFASILQQIANLLDEGLSKGKKYHKKSLDSLRDIIISCAAPLLSLQKVMIKFDSFTDLQGSGKVVNIKIIMKKLRWMMEEKKILSVQQALERQKSTLSAQLLIIAV